MAVTGVTNAHGPSPKPTVCRPPTCSLTTATGSNHATRSLRWMEGQSSVNKSHFDFFMNLEYSKSTSIIWLDIKVVFLCSLKRANIVQVPGGFFMRQKQVN